MFKRAIAYFIILILFQANAYSFVSSAASLLDDLYRASKLTSKISKNEFKALLITSPHKAYGLANLNKFDKLKIFIFLAKDKKIIKTTQQTYYLNKFNKLENGEKLLINAIKNNKNLDDILLKQSNSYKIKQATKTVGTRAQMKTLGLINDFKRYPIKNSKGNVIGNFKAPDFYDISKVIQMPSVIFTIGKKTSTGYLRNASIYWKKYAKAFPKDISKRNLLRISKKESPIVDSTWIKSYPNHKYFKGEVLEHHHLHHNGGAVPLPKTLHRLQENKIVFHTM